MTAPVWDDAARRRLILDLTYADRKAGAASLWHDVYPLIRVCNVAEMDERGTRVYVTRWQEERGRAAWAALAARNEGLQ